MGLDWINRRKADRFNGLAADDRQESDQALEVLGVFAENEAGVL